MTRLIGQTITTLIFGTLLLGVLIFLPAGTFRYWQAWVFIAVFMVTICVYGLHFSIKDPALMERRKQTGPQAEQSRLQKIVAAIAFTAFFCVFILDILFIDVHFFLSRPGRLLRAFVSPFVDGPPTLLPRMI